ncbi:KRAB-A domain-containing protein 2-like [Centruroides sculpturatus]|uniref:KRAB-A domain-containing protein 2-like n=1 Tax=Centruroides sculpturatus TaxID=218467 RepID=UPI000C6D69C5|nr:KRAB-A domain-containing protein 2-like [Centruroides sculpturatus]
MALKFQFETQQRASLSLFIFTANTKEDSNGPDKIVLFLNTRGQAFAKDKYLDLILQVEEAEKAQVKTPLHQRRLKRFATLNIGSVKKLVACSEGNIKYFILAEELYDIIDAAHRAVRRDRLLAETSLKYANITKQMINLYLSMCVTCQEKKTKKERCQVDLIDFQTQPDGKFKFIMVYQDHLTKFILLRALESKQAEEVAYHLNDIFLTIGAPCILQSNNGGEFINCIICEIACLWPEDSTWKIMAHPKAYHSGIKQSSYKAMFGVEPRVGLSISSLLPEIIKDIQDEDDFQKLIETDLTHRQTNYHNDSGDDSDGNDTETSKISDDIQKAR